MEAINCLFCHANSDNIVIKENGFQGRKCASCNLIYISPRPSETEVHDIYGHNDAHISAQTHIEHEYAKRLHAQHNVSVIKKYCSSGALLEIGAGAGYFLDEARKRGFSPYAIELNTIQAQFIKDSLKIPCERTPLHIDSFGKQAFDLIYHVDVLSHFYDPTMAFTIMHAKLKDEGYLVFETGNIADINHNYYSVFTKFQYPDHLFFFGEQSIKKLLEITGFELIKIHRYVIWPQLYIMKFLHAHRSKNHQHNSSQIPVAKIQKPKQHYSRNMLKNCYHKAMHMIRYNMGAFLPASSRPQTLLVIAKKIMR
jgi:2-polyprenyl-3-methyl-5-hydroxy-6-metoxy-1,4-benzoquinol methylase